MPSRIPRIAIGRPRGPTSVLQQQRCLFCSISKAATIHFVAQRPRVSTFNKHPIRVRKRSNLAHKTCLDIETPLRKHDARQELQAALRNLQKEAGSYINVSRLHLALRGLDQTPGQETIRIAILALADGGNSLRKAKQLLRAMIADPLKEEEEWERILLKEEPGSKPLLLKVGGNGVDEVTNPLLRELRVWWPTANDNNLEILVLEVDPLSIQAGVESGDFASTILVPIMEIPISTTGRTTPVTTPVHKALLVGDGILGATSLSSLHTYPRVVLTAANVKYVDPEEHSNLPFKVVDIDLASNAIALFRSDVTKALDYEEGWFKSGVADLKEWLKDETKPIDGAMKHPLHILIDSLLSDSSSKMQDEESAIFRAALSARISAKDLTSLKSGLGQWAERAHTELRDQLDIAFNGRRWRKLGWWKLFWRVDDVSMITSDILNQRFLTNAESEAIFLSGRFQESKIFGPAPRSSGKNWAYKPLRQYLGPGPPPPTIRGVMGTPDDDVPARSGPKSWPLDISATRTFLSMETVPALQALAQKLVLQTLTTSTFSSALAGLIYVSTLTTTLFEAGAVAALGIVWSLRRMQGKWETARKFWEGEVREEGRKAVRGTESQFATVFSLSDKSIGNTEEQEAARKAIEQAETALAACK